MRQFCVELVEFIAESKGSPVGTGHLITLAPAPYCLWEAHGCLAI